MASRAVTSAKTRRYHHGDLKRALVEEARAIATERGAEALTVRELARRLDVAATASYRHFTSKDALLRAVRVTIAADIAERMARAADAATEGRRGARATARVLAAATAYVDFAWTHASQFALLRAPRVSGPRTPFAPLVVLGALIDEAIAAAALPAEARQDGASQLLALAHGVAALTLEGAFSMGSSFKRRERLRSLLSTTLRGLREGRRRGSA